MTGAEHYRQAEVMAAAALEYKDQTDQPETHHVQLGQLAQVHALLALAAATALGREGEGRMMPGRERQAWFDVASECRKKAVA